MAARIYHTYRNVAQDPINRSAGSCPRKGKTLLYNMSHEGQIGEVAIQSCVHRTADDNVEAQIQDYHLWLSFECAGCTRVV